MYSGREELSQLSLLDKIEDNNESTLVLGRDWNISKFL